MAAPKASLLGRAARFGFNLIRSAEFRSVVFLQCRRPHNLFQPFADTASNRYPKLFAFAREQLGDSAAARVLSFGCSTGEEVFSLRRYFAEATIKGIDINPRNIRIARRRLARLGDARICFEVGSSTASEGDESFSAIFCMVVLRHGGLSRRDDRCDHLIRFADFERTANDLARCVAPGGLLFVGASNFRFSDASASKDFEVVYRENRGNREQLPVFDRNNVLMRDLEYCDVGFRKRVRS